MILIHIEWLLSEWEINSYGFNFGLSNNYSLLNPKGRWTGLNASFRLG